MNSEADSSFTSFTLLKNTLKQSRSQVSSAVWTHCHVSHDDDEDSDSKWRYCTHCTTSSIYFSNISFNMWKHLKRQHKINVEIAVSQIQATTVQQLEQLYLQAKLSDQTKEIDAQVFEKQLNQNIINKTLIFLITVQNLLFWMIEWSEFHIFCQVLNSKSDSFITTAHSQIKQKIREAWQIHKNIILKKLQLTLFSIHLFVDIWTFPNRHLLLAVTADFVDYIEEKHVKTLLALCTVKNHSEEEQFAVLLSVF